MKALTFVVAAMFAVMVPAASFAAECASGDVKCVGKKLPGAECKPGDDVCHKRAIKQNLQKPSDTSFDFDVSGALAATGVKASSSSSKTKSGAKK